jgi:Leucine Rich repeat
VLILRDCPHITDEGLAHLVSMKKLTYLDLMGCPGVTDRGLERLMSKTDWTDLLLSGCPHVTAGGVAKLRVKLPKARIEFDEKQWELNKCVRNGH